jgi:hypothetical protein
VNHKLKIYLLIAFQFIVIISIAQYRKSSKPSYSNSLVTNENNQVILLGYCSQKLLLAPPFNSWFIPNFDSYQPDSTYLAALEKAFKKKRIEIYAGTWCGESKADLPKFLKILQVAHVDSLQIKLIFLNNTAELFKQSPQHEEAGKNIVRTPTYIIYSGKKEMGRIIDSPIESFEKDLLKILRNEPYQPHFYDLKL